MPRFEFVTVDVFTDRAFGGNPLAVFPDARGIPDQQMQAIAREFNLSETTFVLPPDDPGNAARVRIFTPHAELPFAGHPNVGTAYVLACRDERHVSVLRFEETAGLVTVRVLRRDDGAPRGAELDAPQVLAAGSELTPGQVAACARLAAADIRADRHMPLVAGVGLDFMIAELRDRDALARARPDAAAFEAVVAAALPRHLGLLCYARDPDDPERLRARMFSPLDGIPEDPATGSANAALAALLVSLLPEAEVSSRFDIIQGAEMGRPSRLLARASKTPDGATHASVGGDCVPMMKGVIEL